VQQDGLRACAQALAAKPYVDPEKLGIYARGYGIVMATGMIAGNDLPRVKFLLDFEGPSDRYQCAVDFGGHVPMPVDSEAYWAEREANRFIKRVSSAYLRIQTEIDYSGRMPNNEHAIALIDSATSRVYGGAGSSIWTRVNDSVMNPENRTYTQTEPPQWIAEEEERNLLCRELIYLHELADRDFTSAVSANPPPAPRTMALSLDISPNPCRGRVSIRFSGSPLIAHRSSLAVYDASGRLVLAQPVSSSSFILNTSSLRAGIYVVRIGTGARAAAAKLVVR
jgi:hypothetical protein